MIRSNLGDSSFNYCSYSVLFYGIVPLFWLQTREASTVATVQLKSNCLPNVLFCGNYPFTRSPRL